VCQVARLLVTRCFTVPDLFEQGVEVWRPLDRDPIDQQRVSITSQLSIQGLLMFSEMPGCLSAAKLGADVPDNIGSIPEEITD
jgi:hypothetical protein